MIGADGIDRVVSVVGWALLHFVWQGVLVAAVTATALALMRSRPAAARHAVALAALLVLLALPAATAGWLLSEDAPPRARADVGRATGGGTTGGPASGTPDPRSPRHVRPATAVEWLEGRLDVLVGLWALGVLLSGARLAAGCRRARRLAGVEARPAGEPWASLVASLAGRLGVRRPVRALESAVMHAPAVVGWLRPAILLPATALTGLSRAQVEALIVHELAHVRRNDVAVSVVQGLAEALLFYHPVVWWLSARLTEEREHSCDDVAVAFAGDPLGYARALAVLEERRLPPLRLAVAADGAPLLDRVRRILGSAPPARRPPIALLVAACLTAGGAALLARTGTEGGAGPSRPAVEVASAAGVPAPSVTPPDPPALTPPARGAGRRRPPAEAHSAGEETRYEVTGPSYLLRARLKGGVRLAPDRRDVEEIGAGGYVVVEERSGAREVRLEVRPDEEGRLRREWFVDGQAAAAGGEARSLLARALPHLATPRAGGAPAADPAPPADGRAGSDHEVRLALEERLAGARGAGTVAEVLREARRRIRDDWQMAELLLRAARDAGHLRGEARAAFFDALATVRSDWEKRRVLGAAIHPRLDAEGVAAVLESALDVRQDYERAELLLELVRAHPLEEPGLRAAFGRAADTIGSDWERRRVREAFERRHGGR